MTGYTEVRVKISEWEELRKITDTPHEHAEGRNECTICDQSLVQSVIDQIKSLEAKNAELRETIHNAKEIYTGMEGFTARTAPEGYLQRILEQMYSELTGRGDK